jgi:hypothetical protein
MCNGAPDIDMEFYGELAKRQKGGGMKLENQVCSLENAKELAELGVKAESLFTWATATNTDEPAITISAAICFKEHRIATAYTVAELGNMLPDDWDLPTHRGSDWGFYISDKMWRQADTEADARALMLIWLIENGHVKTEDLI